MIFVQELEKAKIAVLNNVLKCYSGNDEEVVLPNDVKGIDIRSFHDNTDLLKITLPYTIVCIADQAFAGCEPLMCIEVHNTIVSIEKNLF